MTSPATRFEPGEDIRRVLSTLLILLLAAASLVMLLPFLTAIIWAATIVVATWPALMGLTRRLGGRRGLAATLMTLVMLVVFFVPLGLAIAALVSNVDDVSAWAREIAKSGIPDVPSWVAGVPVVGRRVAQKWHEAAQLSPDQAIELLTPYVAQGTRWLLAKAGGFLLMVVQIILTIVVAAIFYTSGEKPARSVIAFARKLAGDEGERLVVLAARSVRGVALGVVVTALIQAVVSAIALALTGVPGAMLLGAVVMFLCIAQVGPLLVLAPAVGWLYWSGHSTAGTVLLVATIIITLMDNVIRPVLIKKGADLPLLLVFAGVIGGMLTAGVLGIFAGPVVLAVTYTLLRAWIAPPGTITAEIPVAPDRG